MHRRVQKLIPETGVTTKSSILITLLIALILTFIPMPDWTVWLKPNWLLLVLIYWTIAHPETVNVGAAWSCGILLDLLQGTLLGEHAFAFTVVIYVVARMHAQLRMYPFLQQSICILFFILLYQFILYCIQGFMGNLLKNNFYWLSSVTSMLLWPWLCILLLDYQQWSNNRSSH